MNARQRRTLWRVLLWRVLLSQGRADPAMMEIVLADYRLLQHEKRGGWMGSRKGRRLWRARRAAVFPRWKPPRWTQGDP